MRKIVFENDEPSIDIKLSNKTIKNLYPVKLIRENIKDNITNILLKLDYLSEDITEVLQVGNEVSLNIKTRKQYDENGKISSQDVQSIDNLRVVYSYAPIFNKGVITDYIFVLSTDENLSYDMIMKLVEREEKQQLNSSIYKNRPIEIVAGIKDMNGNLDDIQNILDESNKSFEKFKQEIIETMKY